MAIPVPAGTDPACEFAEDWCATAAAINTKIAGYQQTLDRTYPAVPMALLRVTEPFSSVFGFPFAFTEVVADTAGMTDLDADPTSIIIRRSGRFTVRGWMEFNTSGILNNYIRVRVATNINDLADGIVLDRLQTFPSGNGAYDSVVGPLTAGQRVQLFTTNNNLPILAASLSVMWHSDQTRPV